MSTETQDHQQWVIEENERQDEADWQAFMKDFYGQVTPNRYYSDDIESSFAPKAAVVTAINNKTQEA